MLNAAKIHATTATANFFWRKIKKGLMDFTLFSSLHMNECVFLSFKAGSMVWHKLQRKKIVYIAAVLKICVL